VIEEANRAVEGLDWKKASENDTVLADNDFVAKHPQEAHVETALRQRQMIAVFSVAVVSS
jgi:hypothetical protein